MEDLKPWYQHGLQDGLDQAMPQGLKLGFDDGFKQATLEMQPVLQDLLVFKLKTLRLQAARQPVNQVCILPNSC